MSNTEQIKVYRTTAKGVRVVEYQGPRSGYVTSEHVARFNVRRLYENGYTSARIIKRGLTLAEAQAHCSDPETSSSTCEGYAGRRRTRRLGRWFDSYEACK